MRLIELHADKWCTPLDFYEALLIALGAPEGHGRNINALIDSMVYGGICAMDPPYTLRITGTAKLPNDIKNEIDATVASIREAQGADGGVEFQIEPWKPYLRSI